MSGATTGARPSWLARIGRTRLVVLLLALLSYTPGFWWGAPYATAADRTNAWGVDDEPPLGPLAQADDMLHPKPTQNPNLGYPMLHPYLVLGVFTPYMGYLFATRQVQHPTVAFPHGFRDPVGALAMLTYLAHFLSVLLGVGVVLCAFETGRLLWDEASGVVGAVGALLVYPMFYYSRNSNVDVPVLFFTAAALLAFCHITTFGLTRRRVLAFGTLVGLALATKEPSFASFVFAPVVIVFLPDPDSANMPWRRVAFWRLALGGALCAVVVYALFGGLLLDHRRWFAHVEFIRSRLSDLEANGIAFVTTYPRTGSGDRQFAVRLTTLLANCLSWPGLLLGAGGMVALARTRGRDAILALSAIGYLAVLFLSARTAQLRYVMPAAYVLAIYAGRGVVMAWESGRWRWRIPGLLTGGLAAVLLAGWAIGLTHAMLRDSRYAAGAWIAQHARPGDALEYFGSEHKNPPMPASLSSRQAIPFLGSMFRPDTGEQAIRTITDGWATRRPRFVALVPDYTNPGRPYSASCPPAIFRALEDGSLGYRRVTLFQTNEWLAWLRRPALDYPVVNPLIRLYERVTPGGAS